MNRLSLLLSLSLILGLGRPSRAAEINRPSGLPGVSLPGAPLSSPVQAALPAGLPGASLTALPSLPGAAVAPVGASQAWIPPAAAAAMPRPMGGDFAAQPLGAGGRAQAPVLATPQAQTASAVEQVRAVKARLEAQLSAMEAVLGGPDPVLDQVRREGFDSLSKIEAHVAQGAIDPSARIRTHHEHPELPAGREARVGVYPVAADPFQWAHLLIALRAMAEFKLDKIVFVLAGDDPRKPSMTPVTHRHPMGQAVLDAFHPLFEYSPIAVGTSHDGETNIFRILALNAEQAVHAIYLVGGDHYKLKDKNGNDDTLPKIEKKLASGELGHNPDKHQVSVAFIARGDEGETVPTSLNVHMLPAVSFEASSTMVRQGKLALMPHAAYQWVLDHLPGHYGIGQKPQ